MDDFVGFHDGFRDLPFAARVHDIDSYIDPYKGMYAGLILLVCFYVTYAYTQILASSVCLSLLILLFRGCSTSGDVYVV